MKLSWVSGLLTALMMIPAAVWIANQPAGAQAPESSMSAANDTGMISVPSRYSVKLTSDRLEQEIRSKGLKFLGRIDNKANAESIRLALRPNTLLLFADLKLDTQLLHQNQTLGLDLPFRFLVWETGDNAVYITWNNPYYLAQRHGLHPNMEQLSRISQTMVQLAKKAGGS